MNTLLTTIIAGQQLLSVVVLMLVLSSSVTRKLPGLLTFSVMSWLTSLLLLVIWYNMSFFMAISRGQEVTLLSKPSTVMVAKLRVKSPTWPHTVRLST